MVADAGGVGGEAWTCDEQTNGINFIQFVCPSPWLLDAARDEIVLAGGGKERSRRTLLTSKDELLLSLRNHRLLFVTQQPTTDWAGDVLECASCTVTRV